LAFLIQSSADFYVAKINDADKRMNPLHLFLRRAIRQSSGYESGIPDSDPGSLLLEIFVYVTLRCLWRPALMMKTIRKSPEA